jgi:hypothetical protein
LPGLHEDGRAGRGDGGGWGGSVAGIREELGRGGEGDQKEEQGAGSSEQGGKKGAIHGVVKFKVKMEKGRGEEIGGEVWGFGEGCTMLI